jgi:hypothetical protein
MGLGSGIPKKKTYSGSRIQGAKRAAPDPGSATHTVPVDGDEIVARHRHQADVRGPRLQPGLAIKNSPKKTKKKPPKKAH